MSKRSSPIEEEDENIFDETLKIFSKKFNELNKYTHVRSDNTFNISNDLEEIIYRSD